MKTKDSRANHVQVDLKSRRMFLKSAGGFTLALPLLPSLLTAFAEKAMAAGEAPIRFIHFSSPMGGLQHKNWLGINLPTQKFDLYPGQSARISPLSNLVGAGGLSPVIDSRYQNLFPYMNMIAGLDSPIYWGHHRGASSGAFCNNIEGYRPISDQMSMNGRIDADYPSIDQVMAYAGGNGIYGNTISGRRRILTFGNGHHSPSWGRDDYYNPLSPVVPKDSLNTVAGAFNYLFGSIPQSQTQSSTNPLLNLVNEFWPTGKSLFRFLSGEDKLALDNLFQLAQQASNDYTGPVPYCPNTTKPVGTDSTWRDDGSSMRALADVIMLGFQCDITRVISLGLGDSAGLEWHPLSHAPYDAKSEEAGQDGILRIHQNLSQNFFAYLGEKMRTTIDPLRSNTNILDNSLMMWSHEHKCAHETMSIPTVLLGGAGGRINTGQFVDLRNLDKVPTQKDIVGDYYYEGDLINRLWSSIFYAMNIPRSAYEIQRGGGRYSHSLSKGYGQVLINQDGWFNTSNPNYNLSQIGEPWEFIKKSTTVWG